jgi:hypothetical protein
MGLSAGALALGGGLAGLFGGGGASSVQLPPQFNMPNMAGAANNAYAGIGGLNGYNTYAGSIPEVSNITGSLVNNPYSGGYQTAAQTAGNALTGGGLSSYLSGAGLTNAGGQVLNTAMDPQQALYNQQLQQTMAQQGAANAQAGVGTTPYGAGLQDNNIQNFNIAWQNAQLGRQLQGLSGAAGAYQSGAGLMQGGGQELLMGGQTPYSAFQNIGGGQIANLGTLGQFGQSASTLPQSTIQDYLSYLQAGNQAGGVANQQAQVGLQQQQQGFNQNQIYGSQIGGGLASLGNQGYGMGGSGWSNLAAMF